jgi:hypothetical protein
MADDRAEAVHCYFIVRDALRQGRTPVDAMEEACSHLRPDGVLTYGDREIVAKAFVQAIADAHLEHYP